MIGRKHVIRVLVVDEHPLFRDGIAALLSTQPDMTLVAEASNGREAIQQFRAHSPDLMLMDLPTPGSDNLDAMTTILGEFPNARVIVLTNYKGDVQVRRVMKSGARAYVLKDMVDSELLETLRAVHAGHRLLSAEVSYELAQYATADLLTAREIDVLRLMASGNANKQIAAELSVTEDTIKGRVKQILCKLRANDRTHAAMIGIRRGFIEIAVS